MKKVCTSLEMHSIDTTAEDLAGIPSIVLMENASISVYNEIIKKNPKNVTIICGKGNNAGDGLAIARHLYMKGVAVSVFLIGGSEFSGDALINYNIISSLPIPVCEIMESELCEFAIRTADVVVDAIFGTGIHGEIDGIYKDTIELINLYSKYTVSVDIPSGVYADTGEIAGVCVKADETVTFACYKKGMLLFPGNDYCGEIKIRDISIPEYVIENEQINIEVIDEEYIKSIIPKREKNSHKGDYGKVLIIGGSVGLSGAVCMSAEACQRGGAGLVTVAVPDCINAIIEAKLTEPMSIPLKSVDGHLSRDCIDDLVKIINNYDCCLFGVGIGRSDDILDILKAVLENSHIPIIIDADGLYALSKDTDIINNCNSNLILTPHEMEMARLLDCELEEVSSHRHEVSVDFAQKYGLTLILKGAHTIVTSPDAKQYINISGNCGMATGGSGDVLAGILSCFTARGLSETDASILSVYIHGKSGDMARKIKGEDSLIASDITNNIANTLNLLVEKQNKI